MLLSDVSIKRPVFATMLNLVLIVFGLYSLPRLSVDQYPNVDFPVVSVSVVYPGADPESIEKKILEPLENALNGVSGLEALRSTAFPSVASIVLQFKLEKNSDQAAQEVRDKVFAAVSLLPAEAQTPVVQRFDFSSAPIITVALSSNKLSFADLSRLATDVVRPGLQRVDGVASVNPAGIRERELHVRIDRERLAGLGLTPSDLIDSINAQNMDLPAGRIENQVSQESIRVKGRIKSVAELAQLPIISRSVTGGSLRLGDVAEVTDTIAEESTAAFENEQPTILMTIQKQSGTNTIDVAEKARATVAKLGKQLPAGTSLAVVSDLSVFVKGSVDSVKLDLLLGAILATIVVFFFLQDFRITLISAVALPTAVIATFAFLQAKGFTLNSMTTLGLSLSIGILIDDAIIVVENIHRHMSMGKNAAKAAAEATSEIGLAVLATSLTICAVFVPVAFMEGIIGRFFYQFGLTVAFAVVISLFVAFTLTPMLSSRYLKDGSHGGSHGRSAFWQRVESVLQAIDDRYRTTLTWCLDHRKVTVLMGFVLFGLSIVMLKWVPVAFFPKEDRSQFVIDYVLPEGSNLALSKSKLSQVVSDIRAYPGVEKVVSAIGATREKLPNKIRIEVLLVPPTQRTYSQADIMDRVRQDLAPKYGVGGADFFVAEVGGGGGGNQQPIQFVLKSKNWESLTAFAAKVEKFVGTEVPGAIDVTSSRPKSKREYHVRIDPNRAADLAVSTAQVGGTVRALYEGGKISEFDDQGNSYDITMRIDDRDRLGAEDIAGVSITNRRGQVLSLGSIASIEESEAPASIERLDGERQIAVLANFRGKDLNGAVNKVQSFVDANIPADVTVSLSGQAEIMKSAIVAMLRALALAVLLVFMILCAQYERYLAPLVIMAALPLSLVGAFGSLLITGQAMSVFTMIGLILLMGIVTKNGILLIDFTLQRMHEGLSVRDALLEAGPIRLRPILMTTFAAGGGMLPVALGHGVGGEARSPMGVAVIGGLLMSTFLTLIVVPCLFSLVEGLRARMAKRRAGWVG
jgi:hydrophobic/amphiphilic exporter-1 (mainly G- bacteria), HAE1 family